MAHLKIVRNPGHQPDRSPVHGGGDDGRGADLPALGLADHVARLADVAEEARSRTERERSYARRFVRDMSARMPVRESGGACTWTIAGDMLCEILPLARTPDEIETAARALRLVTRLVLDGEEIGAGMTLGETVLSIHGDGAERTVDMHMLHDDVEHVVRFSIDARGARAQETPA